MGDLETGHKWWIRYVVVPLIAGGGVIAILVAHVLSNSQRPEKVDLPAKVSSQSTNSLPQLSHADSSLQPKPADVSPQAESGKPVSEPQIATPPQIAHKEAEPTDSSPWPVFARRKEKLESFPLDSLDYVGSIGAADSIGLVRAPNTITYRVRPGDYLGQNNGRVTGISDSEIIIVELVQDGDGRWTERQVKMPLNTD